MKKVMFCVLCLLIGISTLVSTAYAGEKKDTGLGVSTTDDGHIKIGIGDETSVSREGAYQNLTSNFKRIAVVITGLCAITSLVCFIFYIAKLGGAGDNEHARQQAIVSILFAGFALMLFGGATVIIEIFWNALS